MKHLLKIEHGFYRDILLGNKTFEVRINDRDFKVNDFIQFKTVGDDIIMPQVFLITYILSDWGIEKGYVCMSIVKATDGESVK